MNDIISQYIIALPEVFLFFAICVVVLADVFFSKTRPAVTYYLVQLSLFIAVLITLPQFGEYKIPLTTFGETYVVDKLAVLTKILVYLFSMLSFTYARDYVESHKMASSDYYLLGLLAVLGMSVMASGNSFLIIFLGLELLSLPLYAMAAMYKQSELGAEAAMKYFVLGALASGILLYGISLLYGMTGNIQLSSILHVLAQRNDMLPMVALIFVLAGLMFKFGAVPFHMWVPDVYQGAPTPVTLFIASAPKVVIFSVALRILIQVFTPLHVGWEHMLIVIAILSMFAGNVLAIAQSNLKRMLAYSSIAHIGYTLLGVIAGFNSNLGFSAAMFYIFTYAIVVSGGFAIITVLSQQGVEFDKLEDYRGLNARNPWLAFMFLLLLFSMAGVPPTVGFFAKLGLIQALVEAQLTWLAVLALIFALIGAYYYLRVVMLMYFEEPTEDASNTIHVPTGSLATVSINGSAALLLGLFPSFFIDLCRLAG